VLYIAGSTNLTSLVSLPKRRDLIITFLSYQARVILNATAVADLQIRGTWEGVLYMAMLQELMCWNRDKGSTKIPTEDEGTQEI
jgi:hypothetical protein